MSHISEKTGHGWRQSDLKSLIDSALPIKDANALKQREKAYQDIINEGWPTNKWPAWRHSKMHLITLRDIQHLVSTNDVKLQQISKLSGAINIVVINGCISEAHSDLDLLPEGIVFKRLTDSVALYENSLRRLHSVDSPFAKLNMIAAQSGYVLHVGDGVTCDKPLHIVHVDSGCDAGAVMHSYNVIALGVNSKLTLIQKAISSGGESALSNKLMHIDCAEGAELDLVKWQPQSNEQAYLENTYFTLSDRSRARYRYLNAGVSLGRDEVRCWFVGADAEFDMKAICLAARDSKQDLNTKIFHSHPGCCSAQLIRSVCDSGALVNIHGGIFVDEGAGNTQADFQNKNLLLSSSSMVNTKPDLEIYNDNVICTHGATVGMLNEDSLFYLRSRGLPVDVARRILLRAFVSECYQPLGIELVDAAIFSWLEDVLMNRGS